MITDRTLKVWRTQALITQDDLKKFDAPAEFTKERRTMAERIIRLTQEIQDINLMRGIK
jgi:hypothetical protein